LRFRQHQRPLFFAQNFPFARRPSAEFEISNSPPHQAQGGMADKGCQLAHPAPSQDFALGAFLSRQQRVGRARIATTFPVAE
jgi:hypothetical protein